MQCPRYFYLVTLVNNMDIFYLITTEYHNIDFGTVVFYVMFYALC